MYFLLVEYKILGPCGMTAYPSHDAVLWPLAACAKSFQNPNKQVFMYTVGNVKKGEVMRNSKFTC